jgi:hypothetical protein
VRTGGGRRRIIPEEGVMGKLLRASAVVPPAFLALFLAAATTIGPAAFAGSRPEPCGCDVKSQAMGTWDHAGVNCTGLGTDCPKEAV